MSQDRDEAPPVAMGAPGPEPAVPTGAPDEGARPKTSGHKRKKRRRRAPSPEAGPARAEVAEEAEVDDRVPAFARGWPRDPALDALVAAFEAGDYARVRREAPALAQRAEAPGAENDAVRRAARELRRRLDPDPAAVYMLLAAAALLVFLAGWYWLHPHTP